MSLIDLIKRDMHVEKKLLNSFETSLGLKPKLKEGHIIYYQKDKTCRYYFVDRETGKSHYIRKEDIELLRSYQEKRFLQKSIQVLTNNLKAQEKFLKDYSAYDVSSINQLLPKAYQIPEDWLRLSFGRKEGMFCEEESPDCAPWATPFHPEGLIHTTSFGLKVRSKSEMTIAELLHSCGIPFTYEKPLHLQDFQGKPCMIIPDFTFEPPGELPIFQEHFGMMHDEQYCDHLVKKLRLFHHNGITQPGRLLVTMDGPDGGLDVSAISQLIQSRLLPLFQK